MSLPLVMCQVIRAANGSEKAKADLKHRIEYNKGKAAYSVWPCKCDPPCTTTESQVQILFKEIPELPELLG